MDPSEKNKTTIMVEENGEKIIHIRFPYDLDLLYKIRSLTGRKYNNDKRFWTAPVNVESLKSLIEWGFILDDQLQSFLQKVQKRVDEITDNGIGGLNGKLFPYQNKGVAFIENNKGRALISDETGLGKTIMALGWLQLHPEKRPVVIVVPSSLKLYWKRQAERWMPNPKVEVLTIPTASWKPTGEIFITAYEELIVWVNKLKTINTQVIIIDEIHYIKDKSANQTKAIKKLGRDIPHVICLSGMSIAARPVEAYSAIRLINPKLFPSFAAYSGRYGDDDTKPTYYGWESYGAPPSKISSTFKRSEEKLTKFMEWLQEQINKGLIEIREFQQVGDGIEAEWTNKYIADSYKRKELRSRSELARSGIMVPSSDNTKGTDISMSTPFHIDRVGLLFTRVFSDLQSITDDMDSVISRILAQGMADGDGPVLLARKMEAAINGSGLGDLGITDTIGQPISAKRRAQMLAHTEMHRAYHKATIQDYRNWASEGVIAKAEWKTVGDNRVCDQCNALEGKIFSLDEIEGMIPLHPECRCIALPYIEELQKYKSKPIEEKDWLGLREGINTRHTLIPELYKILTDTIMIRRLKEDVVKDLPRKIYSFVPIELDNVKVYNETEKDFSALVKSVNTISPDSIEGLILLAAKGKFRQSTEWIKNFLEVGNKLIVFSTHKFIIETLINCFSKASTKFEELASDGEIQKAISDFETNPDIKLFVGDIKKIVGRIKLTAVSNIAFLEVPLSIETFAKTVDCFQMVESNICINIHYLFATGTIEERITNLIDKRVLGHELGTKNIETTSFLSSVLNDLKNTTKT
jgi:SPP1 gp7 family putative phage head morphogenesis protein